MATELGVLFFVITEIVNGQGAHAQSVCSSGDRTYKVVGGDTLSGIGARYNANWQQLASYNHIANPNLIYINQVVCIPGRGYHGTGNASGSGAVQITTASSPSYLVSKGPTAFTAPSAQYSSGTGLTDSSADPPKGTDNPFPYPYCTWWADQRFYELHGFYVPWRTQSDAWEWTARAYQFGWNVSNSPTVGSIIDLQPWVQGAYGDGHVGVVEKILPNGDVIASNMSWGSDPYEVVDVEFSPGPGVTFISY